MKNTPEKQSAKSFDETRQLVMKSGYNHTKIAVEAMIGYPRYRRIIIDGVEPTKEEAAQILEAIKILISQDQKRIKSLGIS